MRVQALLSVAGAAVLAFSAAGCELKDDGSDLANGKKAFVEKCGSCHVLERAGTTGVTGPNLDEIGQVTKARIVEAIENGGTGQGRMPPRLLQGEDAEKVAKFVAAVAGR